MERKSKGPCVRKGKNCTSSVHGKCQGYSQITWLHLAGHERGEKPGGSRGGIHIIKVGRQ